jgi:hypothetical protein
VNAKVFVLTPILVAGGLILVTIENPWFRFQKDGVTSFLPCGQ